MTRAAKRKRSHPARVFLILILLFLVPIGLARFLYTHPSLLPNKKTNHGDLVTTPFPIASLKLMPSIRHKWLLLYFYPIDCLKQCHRMIYCMHQIQIATGKNQHRVARAVLTFKNQRHLATATWVNKHFPQTHLASINSMVYLDTIHKNIALSYVAMPGTLFIIDPKGNIIMSYRPNTDPNNIFKDLQHLLKVSQVG